MPKKLPKIQVPVEPVVGLPPTAPLPKKFRVAFPSEDVWLRGVVDMQNAAQHVCNELIEGATDATTVQLLRGVQRLLMHNQPKNPNTVAALSPPEYFAEGQQDDGASLGHDDVKPLAKFGTMFDRFYGAPSIKHPMDTPPLIDARIMPTTGGLSVKFKGNGQRLTMTLHNPKVSAAECEAKLSLMLADGASVWVEEVL